MANNYPYRRQTKDARTDSGSIVAVPEIPDSRHHNIYMPSYEAQSRTNSTITSSSSYPSSSSRASVESSYSSQRSDSALSILSSCGLEPNDLSLLAKLPEELITLDSLPHLLKEMKGKKRTTRSYSTSTYRPSSSSLSSRPPDTNPGSSSEWESIRSQPVQYPLNDYLPPKPPPTKVESWQDRWGNPRQTGPVTYNKPSSSSIEPSGHVVDYDYDKPGKSSRLTYERSSYSTTAGEVSRSRKAPHISQPAATGYRYASPQEDYRAKPWSKNLDQDASFKSRANATPKMPTRKAALDFHGQSPVTYPYSCSLCEITVLSEKYWISHINGPQHADGQLTLLQMFPEWDCRLETNRKMEEDPGKSKIEERTAQHRNTSIQNSNQNLNKMKTQKKATGNGKVVCAKFAAQSVDENYLRKLAEPFGKLVKVIMFPALAFVEMGSNGQAKDLVKYYTGNPVTAKGQEITFYVSSTFNFLQSSRVVSFTPAPAGEDGYKDLIGITKRFGPVLYTFFLPSLAFVEMKSAPDAQKMVEYYSSNTLKMDGDTIKVAFSGEYNTLMRIPSARKFEDESESESKRKRTPSPKRKSHSPRRRDPSPNAKRSREETNRKKERERMSCEKQEGSRSSSRHSRRSTRSPRSQTRDSRSREKVQAPEKIPKQTESNSDKPALSNSFKHEIKEKASKPVGDTHTSRTTTLEPADISTDPQDSREENVFTVDDVDSDIEGMEVIGEDGENLDDEDMDNLDDIAGNEEDKKPGEKANEEDGLSETSLPQKKVEEQKEVSKEEAEKQSSGSEKKKAAAPAEHLVSELEPEQDQEEQREPATEEDEEEPDFPESLENCITLDELDEEEIVDQVVVEKEDDTKSSGRVIYFRNLPQRFYTDSDFIRIVKGLGKVSRYILIRNHREGFLEMSSSSEALRVNRELTKNKVEFNGAVVNAQLSHKYQRLTAGWTVDTDSESNEEEIELNAEQRGRKEETRSASHSDTTENKNLTEEESARNSPERKDLNESQCKNETNQTENEEQAPSDVNDDIPSSSNVEISNTDQKVFVADEEVEDTASEVEVEQASTTELTPEPGQEVDGGPDTLKLELFKPTKPIGTEFVRPVVGYFCNLCKVIYAEEDEAKNEHCTSVSHYLKYMEHTGKDSFAN